LAIYCGLCLNQLPVKRCHFLQRKQYGRYECFALLTPLLDVTSSNIARSGVPHAGKSGRALGTFCTKAKTVFSPRIFAFSTFSTILYGYGSQSNRVTVTPHRAMLFLNSASV
jgi:hypothetical protein